VLCVVLAERCWVCYCVIVWWGHGVNGIHGDFMRQRSSWTTTATLLRQDLFSFKIQMFCKLRNFKQKFCEGRFAGPTSSTGALKSSEPSLRQLLHRICTDCSKLPPFLVPREYLISPLVS
jgi:hypothetical protein